MLTDYTVKIIFRCVKLHIFATLCKFYTLIKLIARYGSQMLV